MERIIQVWDSKSNSLRLFQGIELPQLSNLYRRFNGCFVDGGSENLLIVIDHKSVIQGYEEGDVQVLEPTPVKMPKLVHVRKPRADKGVKRGKMAPRKAKPVKAKPKKVKK